MSWKTRPKYLYRNARRKKVMVVKQTNINQGVLQQLSLGIRNRIERDMSVIG